jgi:uncharacterized membrane protein
MRFSALLFAIVLASIPLAGAESVDKAKRAVKQAGDSVQQVATDAKAVAGAAKEAVDGAVGQVQAAARQAEAVAQAAPMDVLKESVGGHWHNKLVHFPVALGIFGCLFFLAARRWPNYLWPARVLLGSAALIGVVAMRTGESAEEAFEGTSFHSTLEWHETSAKVMLALLLATLLLSYFPSFKKWSWAVAVAACAAVLFTGALGGALGAA